MALRNGSKMRICLCVVVSLVLSSPFNVVTAHSRFAISPYVQNVDKTSATILWKSFNDARARVEYGLTNSYGAAAEGTTKFLKGNDSEASHQSTISLARLKGLAPDTTYHYRVVSGSTSEDRTFRTAPDSHDATFTFLVYGDSRSYPEIHARVASAAAASCQPAFVLTTGDAVSPANGGESVWKNQFFDPADALLRKTWLLLIRGNHDNSSGVFSSYFQVSGSSSREDCYSFEWGPVHVVAINTNSDYGPGSQQYRFLEKDLAGTSCPFKVFFGHHPTYSSGSHGSTRAMQEYLKPLFEKYGVQLVFAGHDHTYERTVVNGVTYIVSGGGGAPLYGQDQPSKNPKSLVFKRAYHFVQVGVTPHELAVTAWTLNENGLPEMADQAVITR